MILQFVRVLHSLLQPLDSMSHSELRKGKQDVGQGHAFSVPKV